MACFVTCSRFVDGVKEAPKDVRSEVGLIEGVKNEMAEDVKAEALIEYEKLEWEKCLEWSETRPTSAAMGIGSHSDSDYDSGATCLF